MQNFGTLYIVATPLGNLADISQRALKILNAVSIIAAEDTRHSKKLLQHYGISTPLFSLHGFNEEKRISACLSRLQKGEDIALISDAGTPLISDPGYLLVKTLRQAGINVTPIPGPCAAITALCAAGLPVQNFVFEGFLSSHATERRHQLTHLADEQRTLILYEAPHRIIKLCQDIASIFPEDREIVLAKELTKTFETFVRGRATELCAWLEADPMHQKGEWVVLISGAKLANSDNICSSETLRVLKILCAQLPIKQAVDLAVQITGEKKNKLYAQALLLSK